MEGILNPVLFTLSGVYRNMNPVGRLGVSPNLCGAFPLPATILQITGVSRDSTGAVLAGCTCTLFRMETDATGIDRFTQMGSTVSDGSGNYSFVVGNDGTYRVTFDLAGAPVRAGLTLKTLSGV